MLKHGIQWYAMMNSLPETVASQSSAENYKLLLHTNVKEIVIPYRSMGGTDEDFTFPNLKRTSDDFGIATPRKLKKSKSDSSSAYSTSRGSKASKASRTDDYIDSSRDPHSPIYEPCEFLRTFFLFR